MTNVILHVVAGAARPRHTLLGAMERTARWTLQVFLHGHIELLIATPGVDHVTTPKGQLFTRTSTLYYDN